MSSSPNFVKTIDLKIAKQMRSDLDSQGFTFTTPPYTLFSAKKKGVSCTLYASGKLVVQGSAMAEFIEFYLEPLLGTFSHSYPHLATTEVKKGTTAVSQPRIGIDESGKGDYFGPLCVAGVYADAEGIEKLKAMGVKDSKMLNDMAILALAKRIRAECVYHIVKINPQKYNELYDQFKNLNSLLAWGHATVIDQLVAKTGCKDIIVDQFANEHVVLTALKRKQLKLNVLQRHRAEEEVVVAAASILARETFLYGLEQLSLEHGVKLPKGASKATIDAGRLFVRKHGRDALKMVGKLHFKTTLSVL